MNIKYRIAVISLTAAPMFLLASGRASAQDVNFTCSDGATLYLDSPANTGTNYCTAGTIPNNDVLNYYSPDGIVVTNTVTGAKGFTYNLNQGDTTIGGAPITPPPSVPSLSGGSTTGAATDSITVTTPGTLFQFDSIDLFASSGTLLYVIQGYDASGNALYGVSGIHGTISSGLTDYTTVGNGGNNEYVSSLVVTLTDSSGLDRLDHIELTVPEGGAGFMFLLLAGGACCGTMFFKPRLAA